MRRNDAEEYCHCNVSSVEVGIAMRNYCEGPEDGLHTEHEVCRGKQVPPGPPQHLNRVLNDELELSRRWQGWHSPGEAEHAGSGVGELQV